MPKRKKMPNFPELAGRVKAAPAKMPKPKVKKGRKGGGDADMAMLKKQRMPA